MPLIVDANPDPTIVETTITAQGAFSTSAAASWPACADLQRIDSGSGIRLNVGDTVIVHFQNNLGHATGIHWHGIELANASDGTPLTQDMVQPGDSFLYVHGAAPGIFWYHPHHHSSTNQVFKGLYGSLIVTDPNEAALQASGVLPSPAQTRTLVLSDITVCKSPNDATTFSDTQPWLDGTEGMLPDQPGPPRMPIAICETSPLDEDGNPRPAFAVGDVPNTQPGGSSGAVSEGQTVLTNGINVGGRAGWPAAPGALDPGAHTLDVQAGQGVRLQIVNTATTRFFRLKLTDGAGGMINLVRVGGQGGLLDRAVLEGGIEASGFDHRYQSGEILLDPGDRADVVFAVPPAASGVLTLWTKDFERVGPSGRFTGLPTVPVAHFNVAGSAGTTYTINGGPGGTQLRLATGDPQIVLGPATATLLDPTAFAPAKMGMPLQDIQLSNALNILGINGVQGAHDPGEPYESAGHVGSSRYASIGETLELTVTNLTGAHHPFHLHGFSIQPLDLTKAASPTYTYPSKGTDNIDVPGGYTPGSGSSSTIGPCWTAPRQAAASGDGSSIAHLLSRHVRHAVGVRRRRARGNERPYINANETQLQGAASDTFSMDGTYSDPDGDAVTLTASIGTITDNADGTWSWSGSAAASQPVYVTVDDGDQKDQAVFKLKVNQPPVVTVANAAGNEGAAIAVHGTATDPEGDPLTQAWSYAPVSGVDPGDVLLRQLQLARHDRHLHRRRHLQDHFDRQRRINTPVVKNGTLTVANVAPVVTVTSPLTGALFIVGTTVTVTASLFDAGSNDTFTASTCTFNWDGGGATSIGAPVGTTCSKANLFGAAGVYTVTVTATDDDGGVGSAPVMIIVYDPDAGFVTGGGTINSAAGAYRPDLSVASQANFGLNSKYHNNATIPTGQTQFSFQAGSFKFHSTSYEWLVVSGPKAQHKRQRTGQRQRRLRVPAHGHRRTGIRRRRARQVQAERWWRRARTP